jgi:hypothetical protein
MHSNPALQLATRIHWGLFSLEVIPIYEQAVHQELQMYFDIRKLYEKPLLIFKQ